MVDDGYPWCWMVVELPGPIIIILLLWDHTSYQYEYQK